ncbi:MAG: hypothetical protein GY861_03530 [bacterium]|nr:hypothetical protein [bacterium]
MPEMNFCVEAEEKMPRAKAQKRSLQMRCKEEALPKKRQRKIDIEAGCSMAEELTTEEVSSKHKK